MHRIMDKLLRLLAGGLRGPLGSKLMGGYVAIVFAGVILLAVLSGQEMTPDTLRDIMSLIYPNA